MACHSSSFLVYEGTQEWKISEPRDCFELGSSSYKFSKTTPEVEFSVPLSGEQKSCGLFWSVQVYNYSNTVDGQPGFDVHIIISTKSDHIGKTIGVKGTLTILDDSNNTIMECLRKYNTLNGNRVISGNCITWSLPLEKISPSLSFIKICCTLQAFDQDTETISPEPCLTQMPPTSLAKKVQLQYSEDLVNTLNKDRNVEGTTTDAILKQGQSEYKVHKCVLAVQSDFFKARFSDRWEEKNSFHVVDMNDPDASPDVLEALISGAYTGKVESFETAMKLLPVTDKYQFKKLKEVCESTISSQLTRKNVLNIFMLAKQFSAQKLQERCEAIVRI